MPTLTLTWNDALWESVGALGAAAEEYRKFAHFTNITAWHTDPVRLTRCEGEVAGPCFDQPHVRAQLDIENLVAELKGTARDRYENAALAYAYGTTWALGAVLNGRRPHLVQLHRDGVRYAVPNAPLADLSPRLGPWPKARKLAGLRDELLFRQRCRFAADYFQNEYDEDELPDHEAGTFHAALQAADGLADAAHAYGRCAEEALHHVLAHQLDSKETDA